MEERMVKSGIGWGGKEMGGDLWGLLDVWLFVGLWAERERERASVRREREREREGRNRGRQRSSR